MTNIIATFSRIALSQTSMYERPFGRKERRLLFFGPAERYRKQFEAASSVPFWWPFIVGVCEGTYIKGKKIQEVR